MRKLIAGFLACLVSINSFAANAPMLPSQGGTGVSNSNGNTITLGGSLQTAAQLTFSGAFASTLNFAGISTLTFPSGTKTLASSDGTNASGTWPISISGSAAQINGATLGTTTATAGNLLIGSGTQWVSNAITGNVTISSAGVTTIGASQVTNSMLAGSIDLTTKVTNTLPLTNGGLGFSTITTGDLVYGSATNTVSKLSAVATGSVLSSNGTGVAPSWKSSPGLTGITLANANNLSLGSATVNILTLNASSGASNRADITLNRFDATNGNDRLLYGDNGTSKWSVGQRAGSENYIVFDETNVLAQLTMTQGSGTSGTSTFTGSVTTGNTLTVSNGGIVIGTAGQTTTIKTGTNACAGSGATMVAGVVTVSTTCAQSGDIITIMKTAQGGTSAAGNPVITISAGTSFTITGGNLDTSTWAWKITHTN